MGILTGKNIVVTGVLTDASLAFGVAQLAQREGATILLTGAGRGLSITERTARKLDTPVPVVEFDVTVEEHVESARAAALQHLGRVDGVLHSIGFAPAVCLGDDFMAAKWNDVAIAMQISAYSLKTLHSNQPADTWLKNLVERRSAAILLPLARSRRSPQNQSRDSKLLKMCGMKDPL